MNLLRALLSFFLPGPPEYVLSPEERARVSLAWDEVFARFAERRRARANADPS